MALTTAQRAIYGRIGAAIARSRHRPEELTAAARKRFAERFEAEILRTFPTLPDAEIRRRATELRKAYMLSLAVKSSVARSKKKARTERKSAPANG